MQKLQRLYTEVYSHKMQYSILFVFVSIMFETLLVPFFPDMVYKASACVQKDKQSYLCYNKNCNMQCV